MYFVQSALCLASWVQRLTKLDLFLCYDGGGDGDDDGDGGDDDDDGDDDDGAGVPGQLREELPDQLPARGEQGDSDQ